MGSSVSFTLRNNPFPNNVIVVVRLFVYLPPCKKEGSTKTFLSVEGKKILMASGRSVVYLWVAREQRTDKSERKIKGKPRRTASEKLNYVPKYYHTAFLSRDRKLSTQN